MLSSKSWGQQWLLAAALLLLLGACATQTPYQPSGDGRYGYSEQKIEKNRYRVTFTGNPSTPRETVQNYLLYRASELTLQNGFDYFTMVDRDVERETRYYSHGYVDDFGYYGFNRRYSYRRSYRPNYYSSTSYPISEYSGIADILMAEGEKPEDDANAYDALDVLQQLQPLVRQEEAQDQSVHQEDG